MPARKPTVRGKQRPVKRLLDEIAPKQQQQQQRATSKPVAVVDLTYDNSSNQTSAATSRAKSSSVAAKQKNEGKGKGKGKGGRKKKVQTEKAVVSSKKSSIQSDSAQQAPGQQQLLDIPRIASPTTTAHGQFFYSPIYRRYFGITPPNPRLYNPRLLEDYVDWYLNVYLEEELPWHSMNIGTLAERVRQSEEEALEEARQFAAVSLSSPVQAD